MFVGLEPGFGFAAALAIGLATALAAALLIGLAGALAVRLALSTVCLECA